MTIGITIIYEIGVYFLNIVIVNASVEIITFLKILLINIRKNLKKVQKKSCKNGCKNILNKEGFYVRTRNSKYYQICDRNG